MQNKIIRIVLSVVLSVSLLGCMFNLFTEKPPEPKKQIVEACLVCAWIAWYQWIKAGGTWSGGDPRPTKPTSKPGDDELL